MARGKKTLELKGRKQGVEVYELTFREIKSIFELEGIKETSFDALLSHFGGIILPLVTNLSIGELENLAPSEAAVIWDAVQEVNAVFFGIVDKVGAKEYLSQFKDAILQDSLTYVATLLSEVIRTCGVTDTPTSSEPSTPPSSPNTSERDS